MFLRTDAAWERRKWHPTLNFFWLVFNLN